jgi:hypothetical protein
LGGPPAECCGTFLLWAAAGDGWRVWDWVFTGRPLSVRLFDFFDCCVVYRLKRFEAVMELHE